ncbi:MAG: hypothetical protein QGH42_04195 [Kiritimatiellia bacterium]|jgi:uncharacterized SAM-binding protein YcdF (DUF218 family)|nr:hypothetical protein [Kiritimatiellia bacterium]
MDALLDWTKHYDCRLATILIPEDRASGFYPNRKGALIPVAEWQIERLQESLPRPADLCSPTYDFRYTHIASHRVTIVPGHYHGTDGEMQALAAFLELRPQLRRVALVTSRFHIRRALQRARAHIADPRIIGVIPARQVPVGYMPRRAMSGMEESASSAEEAQPSLLGDNGC